MPFAHTDAARLLTLLSAAFTLTGMGAQASADASRPPASSVPLSQESSSPETSNEVDLARLDELLKELAAGYDGYRTWGGIAAIAVGAVILPSGVVMTQTDSAHFAGTLTLGLGAGAVLGGVLLLALPVGPRQFRELSDGLAHERTAGRSPGETIALLESEWSKKAESSRAFRKGAAYLAFAEAGVAVALGTYLALGEASGPSFSKQEQEMGGRMPQMGRPKLLSCRGVDPGMLRAGTSTLIFSMLTIGATARMFAAGCPTQRRAARISSGSPGPRVGALRLSTATALPLFLPSASNFCPWAAYG